ncbi:hypothetical protein LXM94_01415 [Rhizobium sp. TRM95111]|uniref:hypothetical protein n=1 Tax=Rhizobium alarense TaxID=2846851 RepID=UPI001F334620|nr:hypothetical protein [Rhizobium alarense]MCF3638628.1 hypothetical protein [Rhizobium alarense]
MTIRNIASLKEELIDKFSDSAALSIVVGDDAVVDLSFVQLVEAARRHAGASGGALSLAAPASGRLLDVLRRGGFLDDLSADDARFWLHQEAL